MVSKSSGSAYFISSDVVISELRSSDVGISELLGSEPELLKNFDSDVGVSEICVAGGVEKDSDMEFSEDVDKRGLKDVSINCEAESELPF